MIHLLISIKNIKHKILTHAFHPNAPYFSSKKLGEANNKIFPSSALSKDLVPQTSDFYSFDMSVGVLVPFTNKSEENYLASDEKCLFNGSRK